MGRFSPCSRMCVCVCNRIPGQNQHFCHLNVTLHSTFQDRKYKKGIPIITHMHWFFSLMASVLYMCFNAIWNVSIRNFYLLFGSWMYKICSKVRKHVLPDKKFPELGSNSGKYFRPKPDDQVNQNQMYKIIHCKYIFWSCSIVNVF